MEATGTIGAPECHWHLHSLDDHQAGWTATLWRLLEYPQLDRNMKVNKKTGRSYWTRNRDDGKITNDSPDGSCTMTTHGMSILLPCIFSSANNFIHPTQKRVRLPSQRSLPTLTLSESRDPRPTYFFQFFFKYWQFFPLFFQQGVLCWMWLKGLWITIFDSWRFDLSFLINNQVTC